MKTIGLILLYLFVFAGCTTSFKISSDPEKAAVFFVDQESGEKKKLGETPIAKTDEDVSKMWGDVGHSGEFAELVFEKEGFATKRMWVPVSSAGSVTAEINVKLKEGKSTEFKTAKEIIDQLFLAQQYARTKQFERALIEIDKILSTYSDFERALSMKGSIHFAKGDFKESLTWFEKALQSNPDSKIALEMTANVRKKLRLPASTRPTKLPGR